MIVSWLQQEQQSLLGMLSDVQYQRRYLVTVDNANEIPNINTRSLQGCRGGFHDYYSNM